MKTPYSTTYSLGRIISQAEIKDQGFRLPEGYIQNEIQRLSALSSLEYCLKQGIFLEWIDETGFVYSADEACDVLSHLKKEYPSNVKTSSGIQPLFVEGRRLTSRFCIEMKFESESEEKEVKKDLANLFGISLTREEHEKNLEFIGINFYHINQ